MSAAVAFRAPNWLGDSVMATVVPPALRRAADVEKVTVLAPRGLGAVFSESPHVDDVVEFERGGEVDAYRDGGYDRVLLGPTSWGSAWRAWRGGTRGDGFATDGRGWLLRRSCPGAEYRRGRHQVVNYRVLAGLVGDPEESDVPQVSLSDAWRRAARERWSSDGRPRVALQPGAAYGPAKRWFPERFAELADQLGAGGADVAVLGAEADRGPVEAVKAACPGVRDLSGRTPLGEFAALLAEADVLVTNDTGPMHLAAAVGTRCVALFGSTSPRWTRPWGDRHRVVRHPVDCSPCFQRTCRIGTVCLDRITVAEVGRATREILEERS